MPRNEYVQLARIGYWYSKHEPNLPHPIEGFWDASTKKRVVEYLKAGDTAVRWRGWSNCRVCDEHNGSQCLTDGTWVWPEGLAHYVEAHGTQLPPLFVAWVVLDQPDYFRDEISAFDWEKMCGAQGDSRVDVSQLPTVREEIAASASKELAKSLDEEFLVRIKKLTSDD